MSDQDLDKLFRNKLEDHREMPSAKAWEQIRSTVGQKKSGFPFLRIAAAIVILCISGAIVWFAIPHNETAPLATNKTEVSKEDKPQNEEMTSERPPAEFRDSPDANKESGNIEQNTDTPETNRTSLPPAQDQPDEPGELVADKSSPAADHTKGTDTNEPMPGNPEPMERNELAALTSPEITEPEEPITADEAVIGGQKLTFSIDEFESAEEVVAAGQPSEDNEEGLKKVWSFLQQVKEPEAGLGELRELKNNILAFGNAKPKKESD
jgi:cytoskeletal protein RodZ